MPATGNHPSVKLNPPPPGPSSTPISRRMAPRKTSSHPSSAQAQLDDDVSPGQPQVGAPRGSGASSITPAPDPAPATSPNSSPASTPSPALVSPPATEEPTSEPAKASPQKRKARSPPDGEQQARKICTGDEAPSREVKTDITDVWVYGIDLGDRNRRLRISNEQKELAEQLRSVEIGGAYLRFVGPGEVNGVVDMRNDPNVRGNPRALDRLHVTRLYDALRVPNGKKDHEAPVLLAVSRQLLSPELQEAMRDADPRDPSVSLPVLEVVRPHAEEENALEEALWSQMAEGRWLERSELDKKSARLTELRQGRGRVVLLNGHHRLRAMCRIGDDVLKEQREVKRQWRDNTTDKEEAEARASAIRDKVESATWRVLVYDLDLLTPALRHALVKNEREKPAKGMGAGETAWWLAEGFAKLLDKAIAEHGFTRREEAANHARKKWLEMSEHEPHNGEPDKKTAAGALAAADGVDMTPIVGIFSDACGMEAMVDCRSALLQTVELLPRPFMTHIVGKWGASALAHLWLSARLLIQIFDVKYGDGHLEAAEFLKRSELTTGGDAGAIHHWVKIHSRPEQRPILLEKYTHQEADAVDECYVTRVEGLRRPHRGVDYESDETYHTMRNAFEALGLRWSEKQDDADAQLIATSFRLYARLPRFDPDHPATPCFYPTVLLPAHRWLSDIANRWTTFSLPINGLYALEMLLNRWQLAWTMGAQTVSRAINENNWYRRSRGLHQVLMFYFEHEALGPVEHRLSQAITVLEDVRLPRALMAVKNPDAVTPRDIIHECSARKSSTPTYPVLEEYRLGTEWEDASRVDLLDAIRKAREALKRVVFESTGDVLAEVRKHRVLVDLIPDSFWEQVRFREWVEGWNDSKHKQMGSIIAALGWGFAGVELWRRFVLPALKSSRETHYLMKIAMDIARMNDSTPWWDTQIQPRVLDRPTTPPPPPITVAPPALPASKGVSRDARRKAHLSKPHLRFYPRRNADQQDEQDEQDELEDEDEAPRETHVQPPAPAPVPAPVPTPTPLKTSASEHQPPSAPASMSTPSSGAPGLDVHVPGDTSPGEQLPLTSLWQFYVRPELEHGILPDLAGQLSRCQANQESLPGDAVMHPFNTCALHVKLYAQIEEERRHLREAVRQTVVSCETSPFGSEFALTWLAPTCTRLKRMFLVRVSRLIHLHCGISMEAAMCEAARMVSFDGLPSAELVKVDVDTGEISIDLKTTFVHAVQDYVTVPTSEPLVRLNSSLTDRITTLWIEECDQMLSAGGLTEAQSLNNAWVARAYDDARYHDNETSGVQRTAYLPLGKLENFRPCAPEPMWDEPTARANKRARLADRPLEFTDTSIPSRHSSLSSGEPSAMLSQIVQSLSAATNLKECGPLLAAAEKAVLELKSAWTTAQKETLDGLASELVFNQAAQAVSMPTTSVITPQQIEGGGP